MVGRGPYDVPRAERFPVWSAQGLAMERMVCSGDLPVIQDSSLDLVISSGCATRGPEC